MGFSVLVLAKKPSSSHRKTEKEHTRSYRPGISEKSFIRLLLDVVRIPVNGFRVEKEFNKIKRIYSGTGMRLLHILQDLMCIYYLKGIPRSTRLHTCI